MSYLKEIRFMRHLFWEDLDSRVFIPADANFGVFRVVKFSQIVKFQQFWVDFNFMVAKYGYIFADLPKNYKIPES